ncbi:hypothetical protein [Phenylobacterium sp.]|nr:hypothetical protein [Phenylobacterium sp.]
MALKTLIAAVLAAAIAVGFVLPGPHGALTSPRSQIPQIDVGRR